jgi:hypothetical protein
VGSALQQIGQYPDVLAAMFAILETQQILAGESKISIIPPKSELLTQLLASKDAAAPPLQS